MTPKLDKDGNLIYSQVGRVWLAGDEALLQNLRTHLLLQTGEYLYDPSQGVDFNTLLYTSDPALTISTLYTQMQADPDISYVNIKREPSSPGSLHLDISIKTSS